jgi:adenosylhomocysteine nucleosidase
VLHTGVGEPFAARRVREFLREREPEFLLSAGFAGALSDSWQPAELLIAQNFSSERLRVAAQNSLGHARIGTLSTNSAIVDASAARAELAQTGADAVDMETRCIAELCATKAVPMLSLRAISDTPSHPFPAPPELLFDIARQRTNFARLACYVATHPAAISRFTSFARQIKLARLALAEALRILLNSNAI